MRHIAIIPARSGSKGLKDKNIRLLNGKPLLAYTIEAAKKSGCYSKIIVSTDSEKYAIIAKKYGAEVPFLRSAETATDYASSWDVVKETLNRLKEQGEEFDTFTLLQPTSPMRTSSDIKKAFFLMEERRADSIISVCEMEHSPLWCNTLPDNRCMKAFLKTKETRRQDLNTFYRLNGAIYLCRTYPFLRTLNIYGERSFAYIMDTIASVDIDSEIDFRIVEILMSDASGIPVKK